MSLSASLQKIDQRIFLKGEHQAASVYFGQLALSDLAVGDLAAHAANLITQALQAEYCLVWQLKDDGQSLLLLAESGRDESLAALSEIPLLSNSLEEGTLSLPDPIIVEESRNNAQVSSFNSAGTMTMKNGVSVRIGTSERPYGILQTFSLQEHFLSQNDIYFLQSIANTMAIFLHREQCRQEKVSSAEIPAIKARSAVQSGFLEWDHHEIKNRLVESQERERLRLAQDLHDIPIQDLYGMIYQLDDLRNAMKDPDGAKTLDECEHTLHRVVNSLRAICRELRPPSLSPFGLEVAIRDHVEKFRDQNPDIRVSLELMQDKQALSDRVRLTLFRIYQQAILNVARHAQATEVHIRFRWDEKTIILEIEDNGIGFEVPENWVDLVREEHFGILGIAERVESIRGELEIISTPGGGTLIQVIAPYSPSGIG